MLAHGSLLDLWLIRILWTINLMYIFFGNGEIAILRRSPEDLFISTLHRFLHDPDRRWLALRRFRIVARSWQECGGLS
jgi:hypothetical protein